MVMPGLNLTLAVKRAMGYHHVVIKSFKCKETEKIFNLESSRKIPPGIQQIALRKLRMLHRSTSVADLKIPPANRLEKLSGNRGGQWSIRVNDQWRICFEWHDGHAFRVEIVDYH
jgi:proteic killer suppression protein